MFVNKSMDGKHRPGIYNKPNKAHKTGRHRSKGSISTSRKGRSNVVTLSKHRKCAADRLQRRNQVQHIRKLKRDEVLAEKRSRGSVGVPPFLVMLLSMSDDVDISAVIKLVQLCDDVSVSCANSVYRVSCSRFRQRFELILPKVGDMTAMLDIAKIADCVVVLMSASGEINEFSSASLSCLLTQGLPSTLVCIQGLKSLPIKKQSDVKKDCGKLLDKWFPNCKLYGIDTSQEAMLLLRAIGSQKLVKLLLREYRPHMLVDDAEFIPSHENDEIGTLKVSGYLRGQCLSVNSLVHLTGWGDYQMDQIDKSNDRFPLNVARKKSNQMDTNDIDMSSGAEAIDIVDVSKQTSLDSEAPVNELDAEQTFPTDEELAMAEGKQKQKQVKRVPRGTSEYQAAWIIDSDQSDASGDEDDSEDDDDDDDDLMDEDMDDNNADGGVTNKMDSDSGGSAGESDQESDTETITIGGQDEKYDATVNMEEDAEMLKKYKAARLEVMFPDEIDTPSDKLARIRFQKYRGLKSFRTSPWDPKEDLPSDYARIFRFENFQRTRKRVMNANIEADYPAKPGMYVTLHVKNVPKQVIDAYKSNCPLVVFGLLEHEHKMSVVHLLVKRCHDEQAPIKSKDPVIFHVGYRRFSACPIYSQHTNMDKHKFERFFPTDAVTVATIFAPIMFPPGSVLMFRPTPGEANKPLATGRLLSVDPDRVIVKRIVLSGHPFKINKKHAVVRFMFFNADDVNYFKPVELKTKWGRRGHIKESLGTHGHMKCVFDGQLKSQDTVLMHLYKRVYPKWTFSGQTQDLAINHLSDDCLDMFE